MRKTSFLFKKSSKVVFYCLSAMLLSTALISCDKEDEPLPPDEDTKELIITPTSVSIVEGESVDCIIGSGNGGYSTTISDTKIVSASIKSTTITLSGLTAGSAIVIVKDGADKTATINVTVTSAATGIGGENNINTAVKYTIEITNKEKGSSAVWSPTLTKKVTGTYIITKRDFVNKTGSYNVWDYATVNEFFDYYADDDNAFLAGGYIGEGTTPDYGYSSPALIVTDQDDPNHPGCKKIQVVASNIAGFMDWAGYTDRGGTGWYDPSDGSFTLSNTSGSLGWSGSPWNFTYDRKYTPEAN